MTLYLVHGNAYYESYGHMEHAFGIYTDKAKPKLQRKLLLNSFMRIET